MRTYLVLLRVSGVARLTASQLLARLPLGLLNLAVLLHAQLSYDSYAIAGAIVACVSLGEAVGTPVTSRLTVGYGVRGPLLSAAGLNATLLMVLAFAPLGPRPGCVVGFVIGATVPPLMPVVRAMYRNLVPNNSLRAMFALDTTAQELIWVAGPVAATALAAAVSTVAPLVACAVLTLVGTVAFCFNPEVQRAVTTKQRARFGKIAGKRVVMVALLTSLLMVANFGTVQVAVIVFYGEDEMTAGVGVGVACVGSLFGGLVFGHRETRFVGLLAAIAILVAGTALAGIVESTALVMVALFLSGTGFAPALSWLYHMVSVGVDDASATEAFAWLHTGALVGLALGTAIGGLMADLAGSNGAYLAGTILGVVALGVPLSASLVAPLPGLRRGPGLGTTSVAPTDVG